MTLEHGRIIRMLAVVGTFATITAFSLQPSAAPVPGMTFNMKVTLKHTPTTGRAPRAITLRGRGQFAGGMGRIDIDTVDAPGPFRKGDFIIIRDTLNSFWARPSDLRVRRMNAPLVNPLEGISERLNSGPGSPSSLKVDLDTVSLDENVNGMSTRHFRITADAIYPVGSRQVSQKVVIEQWLAKIPVKIVNPFGSRIRGLPVAPVTNGDYRAFINTLSAANRVFGEAVTIRTTTTTSYVYGPGLGEDYFQTVELTDLKETDVDATGFQLGTEYKLQPVTRDTMTGKPPATPPRKPPTR